MKGRFNAIIAQREKKKTKCSLHALLVRVARSREKKKKRAPEVPVCPTFDIASFAKAFRGAAYTTVCYFIALIAGKYVERY